MNLRDKQIACLQKMLSLAPSGSTGSDFSDQWKVLIYDQDCRDIISPLLNVGALRQKGVTLHLLLHADREAIPDAPAVYFIRPTEANLKRVVEDCSKQLYRCVYLNFVTRIERPLLEKFAQDLVAAGCAGAGAGSSPPGGIVRILDQYLDCISLEQSLFTLNFKDAFAAYNAPNLTEAQIRSFMQRVATGLLCAIRVLGALPIIRAPRGAAAEMLAQELGTLLKGALSRNGAGWGVFEDCLAHDKPRPLLVILERSSDFFPMVQHNNSYLALVADLLDFRLNRVSLDPHTNTNTAGAAGASKKKTYELSAQSDPFLQTHAALPFPQVVEANEKELNEIREREKQIRSSGGAAAAAEIPGNLQGGDLSEAIDSLPELLARKNMLEAHTSVLGGVMRMIGQRDVPSYFELEQAGSMGRLASDRSALLALLRDPNRGLLVDKLRLLMALAAAGDQASLNKLGAEELEGAVMAAVAGMSPAPSAEEVNRGLEAVRYVRKMVSLGGGAGSGGMLGGGGGMLGGGGAGQSGSVISSLVKATHMLTSLSPFSKPTPYPTTRTVEALANGEEEGGGGAYVYIDVRHPAATAPPANTRYNEVMVFMLGGGSYAEYHNLLEAVKTGKGGAGAAGGVRTVVYGTTDLVSGDEFVRQIERMVSNK